MPLIDPPATKRNAGRSAVLKNDLRVCRNNCCRRSGVNRLRSWSGGWGLSLLGSVVCVVLPKCPFCLTAYLAVGTGISLSATQSRHLHFILLTLAIGSAVGGITWSVVKVSRRHWL